MRFLKYTSNDFCKNFFYKLPNYLNRDCDKDILSYALGATLYTPAFKCKLLKDIVSGKHEELMSMVICLEDAIGDKQVIESEKTLVDQMQYLNNAIGNGDIDDQSVPFIFVRVRSVEQMDKIVDMLSNNIYLLTGFVFPKFSCSLGEEYFEMLKKINSRINKKLYAMPILESESIIYKESRMEKLQCISEIFEQNKDLVLNIRIGAADFCRTYGIRRDFTQTIYDIAVVADCISDIINYFGRAGKDYVISGPVWEYFQSSSVETEQFNLAKMYSTITKRGDNFKSKIDSLDKYTLGLIRETIRDKSNGLIGKTVIHPSQIKPVQFNYVVNYEEYKDACDIIQNSGGEIGVLKSEKSNKMNEIKTHFIWANKIMKRAEIYGVYNEQYRCNDRLA